MDLNWSLMVSDAAIVFVVRKNKKTKCFLSLKSIDNFQRSLISTYNRSCIPGM